MGHLVKVWFKDGSGFEWPDHVCRTDPDYGENRTCEQVGPGSTMYDMEGGGQCLMPGGEVDRVEVFPTAPCGCGQEGYGDVRSHGCGLGGMIVRSVRPFGPSARVRSCDLGL